jgi:hypothetical protein
MEGETVTMSETPQGSPLPEPYQETTDPEYATTAAAVFEIQEEGNDGLTLRGPCPRCHAEIEIPVVSRVVRGLSWGTRAPAAQVPDVEPVICTCAEPHGGRPEGRVGCGAYWNFTL